MMNIWPQFEIMSTQYCQCFVLFATYEQAGQGVVVVDYIDIYFLVPWVSWDNQSSTRLNINLAAGFIFLVDFRKVLKYF